MIDRVKVGGVIYRIERIAKDYADDIGIFGRVSHSKHRIQIQEGVSTVRYGTTLLHEILHCIETQWDLDKHSTSEHWVTCFEAGLHAVIVDNHELFDQIVADMRSEQ